MEESNLADYEGKKCIIILKNNYKYTAVIPKVVRGSIKVYDKFGEEIDIACSFIEFIKELHEVGK